MLANKNSDDLKSARVGGMMPPTAREGEKLAIDETLAETLFTLESEGDVAPLYAPTEVGTSCSLRV